MEFFRQQHLSSATRYDLIAFNIVCVPKYNRLGIPWKLDGVNLVTCDVMERLAAVARHEGLEFAHWSGMIRTDKEVV